MVQVKSEYRTNPANGANEARITGDRFATKVVERKDLYPEKPSAHTYDILHGDDEDNPSFHGGIQFMADVNADKESPYNNPSVEAVLMACRMRISSWQETDKGKCAENEQAIIAIDNAIDELNKRSTRRLAEKAEKND